MPRERSRRSSRKTQNTEKPSRPAQDDQTDGNSNEPMEKDEVEEELERLVFGDEDGFKRGLQLQTQHGLEGASEEDEQQDPETLDGNDSPDEGLEGVDDAEVSRRMSCNDQVRRRLML